ncbi:MBL fold metallo-hydrolase [Radicibacter daui]|uniref:MBL fold metallo-hydrolase n=1 Tax=Radicibacter daui TaxID=3064829 RepID=UPI0040468D46
MDLKHSPTLHFHGATHTVTGSCYLLEAGESRVLIDCGMFQGSKTEKELNYRDFPFNPKELDAVLLTHAHIDHSGLLPKLVRDGYDGAIYATRPTIDLCEVMLPDSGHIQEMEVEHLNRRNRRRGRDTIEPIYTASDAVSCLTFFRAVKLGEWNDIAPNVRARYWNAGHLLGSSSIEIEVTCIPATTDKGGEAKTETTTLLFSGDIGPRYKLLEHDPEGPSGVDFIICESTYGAEDRPDVDAAQRRQLLKEEVKAANKPGGVLLIPSFAVERTQELLVDLVGLMEEGALPRLPVVIDSPLATRASEIFDSNARSMEGGEALIRALHARNVRFTESVEQSMALDRAHEFQIIISASGMCEAGRIRHRLKSWLWKPETTVLFVGFQAEGTLGRILQQGASQVRIQGDEVMVRARIRTLDLYSGHADGPELADWIKARGPIRRGLFLVHGEEHGLEGLKARVEGLLPAGAVTLPTLDAAYTLGPCHPWALAPARMHRLEAQQLGHQDWHNDMSRLVFDIGNRLEHGKSDAERRALMTRLRKALIDG